MMTTPAGRRIFVELFCQPSLPRCRATEARQHSTVPNPQNPPRLLIIFQLHHRGAAVFRVLICDVWCVASPNVQQHLSSSMSRIIPCAGSCGPKLILPSLLPARLFLLLQEWDSVNTQNSEMVRALDTTQRLVYLQGKPKKGGLVSSRDFCYVMYRFESISAAPLLTSPKCTLAVGEYRSVKFLGYPEGTCV